MPRPSNRYGRFSLSWSVWLVLVALALAGLRHYRVDNSLDAWMPGLVSGTHPRSYLVLGHQGSTPSMREVARRLRDESSIAWCLDVAALDQFESSSAARSDPPASGRADAYAGMFVFPAEGVDDERFVADVCDVLQEFEPNPSERIAMGGPAAFHLALNRWSQDRLPLITGLIALTGMIITWGVTRRWRVAVSSTAAIVMSQIVLLGAATAAGYAIDMSLSLVPPLMIALGYSYAIHHAMRPAVGLTLVLCLLTTIAGIGAFAFTGLPPIRAFAMFGIAGLVLVWLAVIMLVPAAGGDDISRDTGRGTVAFKQWIMRRPRTTIVAASLVTVLGALGILRLRFETDPLRYFPSDARIVRDYVELNDRLIGMLPFQVIVDGEADPTALLLATPGVRRVIDTSILGSSMQGEYWCLADNDALPELMAARDDWTAWADTNGVAFEFTGVAAQLATIGGIVARTAAATLPVMALIAMLAAGFVARSGVFALVALGVNLLPLAVLTLFAGGLDVPLNLPSLMIGAIAIGVAIDDTIHLAASYRERGSIVAAWRECRLACAGSSLAVAACLSLFMFSQFRPTAQFGGLMALAVGAATVGDLMILPVMLDLIDSRRSRLISDSESGHGTANQSRAQS